MAAQREQERKFEATWKPIWDKLSSTERNDSRYVLVSQPIFRKTPSILLN